MKQNALKEKSYVFALLIVTMYKHLSQELREFILSKQLLRSGTSIGAMVEEANQADSKSDFIHKLSIANKEANETHYWLRLLNDSNFLSSDDVAKPLADCKELIKLLAAIIKTSKQNKNK